MAGLMPLYGTWFSLTWASSCSSSPARCAWLPAPGEAKLSSPGFCPASLSSSASVLTGVAALTTSTFSAVASIATGARSAGLYGRFGISVGFTAILPTGTSASV
ncbi:hypothetical protein D9M72_601110 [compost metagenome]